MDELDYPTITRELISRAMEFFAGMGGVVALYYLEHPAEWRITIQQIALFGKRYSQKQADRWQKWADVCATIYNKQKV